MQTTAKQPSFLNEVNYFFDISTGESVNRMHGLRNGPVRQPHYQIVWITQGSGFFIIDLEKYRIDDNCAFTIPPGRFHQIMAEGRLSGFVFSFNIDFLYLAIESPERSFFKELCSDLKRVKTYSMDGGGQALQSLLAGTSCARTRLFNNFYAKVDNEFRTKKHVAEYARELSVSPNYLSEVVRKVTGHSAGYHIRQRTVQEAKRLVIYNDASMKMVAYALGFDDLSHFSKYFKNAAGMTFRDFRKKLHPPRKLSQPLI